MCINGKLRFKEGIRKHSKYLTGEVIGSSYSSYFAYQCGYCEICQKRKQAEWLIRNHYHSKDNPPCYFLTLTYPPEQKYINYDHFIHFIDRLKKHYKLRHPSGHPLTYFVTCEYGETNHRPHYHVILWCDEFITDAEKYRNRNIADMYISKTLDSLWTHGLTFLQHIVDTDSLANYCTSFTSLKKFYGQLKNNYITDSKNKLLYTDEDSIKKAFYSWWNEIKPRCQGSSGLGFDAWHKRLDSYKSNGNKVYVSGIPYKVPYKWLEKLSRIGSPDERRYAQSQSGRQLELHEQKQKVKRYIFDSKIKLAEILEREEQKPKRNRDLYYNIAGEDEL